MPNLLESFQGRLASLSPQEAAEATSQLLEAIRTKAKADPLSFFEPHSERQLAFFASPARERWAIAANRFGKTTAGGLEAIWHATGRHPHRKVPEVTEGWIVSLDFVMQRDIIQQKIVEWMPKGAIANITYREQDVWDRLILKCARCKQAPREKGKRADAESLTWWCPRCDIPTSVIGFKSCDQGRSRFQGKSLDWVWWDEEPPEDIYDESKIRLIDRKGSCWGTMTPVNGMSWTFDRILHAKSPDIKVFGGSMFDNPHLSRAEVEKAISEEPDEAMRRIRFYGEYQTLSGLIYNMYDEGVHEVDSEKFIKHFCDERGRILECYDTYAGIDTGRHFAAMLGLVDFMANIWLFAEHYAVDQSIASNARALHAICRQWGIWPTWILDATSQFEVDLGEHGIPCIKTPEAVDVGIALTIQYLKSHGEPDGHPRLYIVRDNCPRWRYERMRYQWDKPAQSGAAQGAPKNKPRKIDDHALDASRMIVQQRPAPSERPEAERDLPREADVRKRTIEEVRERQNARDSDEFGEDNF